MLIILAFLFSIQQRGLANLSSDATHSRRLAFLGELLVAPLYTVSDHIVKGHALRALNNISIMDARRLGIYLDG